MAKLLKAQTASLQTDGLLKVAAVCHMFSAAMDLVNQEGQFELNPSIKEAVDTFARNQFMNLNEFIVAGTALSAVNIGDGVLGAVDVPNQITRCLAVAFLIVKMVDAGELSGHTTLAAAALGIVLESEDEGDPVWASASQPKIKAEQMATELANRLLTH